jgi:hypothetical protein
MSADQQPVVLLVVLALLCVLVIVVAIGVFHTPVQSTGVAVLTMLMFGRWRVYRLVVRATECKVRRKADDIYRAPESRRTHRRSGT